MISIIFIIFNSIFMISPFFAFNQIYSISFLLLLLSYVTVIKTYGIVMLVISFVDHFCNNQCNAGIISVL